MAAAFAGTIQAYVPMARLDAYAAPMRTFSGQLHR